MNNGEVLRLHREAVVIDAHCDTVHLFGGSKGPYVFGKLNPSGHIDLPRLRAGGVDIQFFAIFTEPEYKPRSALWRTITLLEQCLSELEQYPAEISVIRNGQELREITEQGKIGAILSLEGAEALESVEILSLMYRLGLRSVGLTWNQRNMLADGVGAGPNPGGLTKFGREIVGEMNSFGILIDAAHLAVPGFFDLLETSTKPIAVTHANAAAVCAHNRNLTDEQLRALRDHGGVVGLTYYPPFVNGEKSCGIDRLLDHFCYIAERFGTGILGLGSDYDGISTTVEGLEDVAALPLLTAGLMNRGFSAEEVKLILGGNFLRLLRNVLERGE